jgi:two-component system OmpR family sensor kinase
VDDGISREILSPAGLLSAQCEDIKTLARRKGIEISCRVDRGLRIEGDAGFLGQLFQNLLSNALKFTPEGGAVEVTLSGVNGEAVLRVADSGPGIPVEQRARIFDRFHRVNEGKDQREGAGLGLAIVAWVARVHGGRITVSDRPGGGTAFEVAIPVAEEEAPS